MAIATSYPFVLVTGSSNITPRSLSANVLSALQGVRFIAQHIRDADKDNEVNCVLCRRYFFFLSYTCQGGDYQFLLCLFGFESITGIGA